MGSVNYFLRGRFGGFKWSTDGKARPALILVASRTGKKINLTVPVVSRDPQRNRKTNANPESNNEIVTQL